MNGEILMVDDHEDLTETVRQSLRKDGFRVRAAKNAQGGLAALRRGSPELILLDINLPDSDGLEFCRQVRQSSSVPIVFLTARKDEMDRVLGLRMGADDYVTKPFSAAELTARIHAVLRRCSASLRAAAGRGPVKIGEVEADFDRHELRVRGEPRDLTPKEFQLLKTLADAGGKVVSRRQLLSRVWGISESMQVDTRTIEQHIVRLRQKLAPESGVIVTVRNYGYRVRA